MTGQLYGEVMGKDKAQTASSQQVRTILVSGSWCTHTDTTVNQVLTHTEIWQWNQKKLKTLTPHLIIPLCSVPLLVTGVLWGINHSTVHLMNQSISNYQVETSKEAACVSSTGH